LTRREIAFLRDPLNRMILVGLAIQNHLNRIQWIRIWGLGSYLRKDTVCVPLEAGQFFDCAKPLG
jgi:hypothetical protein